MSDAARAIFRFAFLPTVLGVSAAAWIWREALVAHFALKVDFGTVALLLTLLAVFVAEQVFPAVPAWNYRLLSGKPDGIRRLGRDLFYVFIVTQLSALAITLVDRELTSRLAALGLALDRPRLWPSAAPFAARVALAFFVLELGSYGYHRAAHRVPLLWRFHSTHHVVAELTGAAALRTHPLDNVLFFLARTIPLVVLGAGAEEVSTAGYLCGVLGILAHANVEVSPRLGGLLLNVPAIHALHHAAEVQLGACNYGCHTVLWDRVFGTFRPAPKTPPTLGLSPPGPRSLWQELVAPPRP
ncbi:MAG: sterol desaturase family protein [Myxococcaceae bacterium]|nr:sterol desaturase family protein [Myxococcaceae bacterium]